MWLKDVFKDVENEEDEDFELDHMTDALRSRGAQIIGEETVKKSEVVDKPVNSAKKDDKPSKNTPAKSETSEGINEWDTNPTSGKLNM